MKASERHFLNQFTHAFEDLRSAGTPIALYGVGDKTRLLLENNPGFNILGLMDQRVSTGHVYGAPILGRRSVLENARCIIIMANLSVAPVIYERIAPYAVSHGIRVAFANGHEPSPGPPPADSGAPSSAALEEEIDRSDIVSFDLFDTLIMRRVLQPEDVFDLVEASLRETHGLAVDFRAARVEAERHCYRRIDRYCTIHDIYRVLGRMLPCDEEVLRIIRETETRTESNLCVPREAVIAHYRRALGRGKTVLITTDTFLTQDLVLPLLARCDITGYSRLLISCEEKKLKHLGDMWRHIRELYPAGRILHIGDNRSADIENAEKAGMRAFKIDSAYELLSRSRLQPWCERTVGRDDRLLLGTVASRMMNNPFRGLQIDSPYHLGYTCFGPLVLGFMLWLIRASAECNVDRLLFFARDGYILHRIYENLRRRWRMNAPEALYFLTSRRAASVASIDRLEDIELVLEHVCNRTQMPLGQLLPVAFGVAADPDDPLTAAQCHEVAPDQLVRNVLERYGPRILCVAGDERRGYRSYIDSLGLVAQETLGCVNFVGRGVTQRLMGRIMGREMIGFYFARELEMLDVIPDGEGTRAFYEGYLSPHVGRSQLAGKALFGEVVFSSPQEQVVKFNHDGVPVFDRPDARRDFHRIAECHAGIERFVDDLAGLDPNLSIRRFDTRLVDSLFGLFAARECLLPDSVRNMFLFDDYYTPLLRSLPLTIH